ncbi:hypothetical protein EMCRGX_G015060 [Ephydatia muelleri]
MSKRTVRPPDRYLHENIEIAIDGKRAEDRDANPRSKTFDEDSTSDNGSDDNAECVKGKERAKAFKKRPASDLRSEMPSNKKSRFSDSEMEEIECGKGKGKGKGKGIEAFEKTPPNMPSGKKSHFSDIEMEEKVQAERTNYSSGMERNESLEQGKLNNTSEKVYRLLEAHFTPLCQECIVQDPGPAEYKGPAEHKGTTGDMQQEESHFISKSGVNLLQIRSQNPGKYALALLDALFSNEEQSTCCYKASTKTNSSSVSQKPPLSPNRVKLLNHVPVVGLVLVAAGAALLLLLVAAGAALLLLLVAVALLLLAVGTVLLLLLVADDWGAALLLAAVAGAVAG